MAFTLVKASNIDTAATLSFTSAGLSGSLSVGTSTLSSTFRVSIRGNCSSINGGLFFDNGGGDNVVVGYASATSPSFIISNQSASGILRFDTNNTERMRVDSSGNIGIGTSSPVASNKLTIDNGTSSYGLVIQNTGGNDVGFKLAPNGTTQFYFTSNSNGNASMESNGATIFRTNNVCLCLRWCCLIHSDLCLEAAPH